MKGREEEGRGGEEVGVWSLMGTRGGGRYGVTGAATATATATIANMGRALFGSGTRERAFLIYLRGEHDPGALSPKGEFSVRIALGGCLR